MSLPILTRRYDLAPTDKTLIRYTKCRLKFQGIMGPWGSGKTLCTLMKFLRLAVEQAPHPRDGVRRTRWVIVRDTYRNLERSVLRTWKRWVPPDVGRFTGGANGEPATHLLAWPLPDETSVETEFIFIAVGEQDVEAVARGFEPTGVQLNEGDQLPEELFTNMVGRVGRYPEVDRNEGFAGATWAGILVDLNAPNFGNWIEERFIKSPTADTAFFRQPGGLEPDAENLQNLPGGRKYYETMAANNDDWWVRRMVNNELGFSRDGKPVYGKSFQRRIHVAQFPIKPIRERRIVVGLDGGRWPAAVAAQPDVVERLRFLGELCVHGIGAAEFGRLVASWVGEKFPNHEVTFVGDPAAFQPTELSEHAEDVFMEIVASQLGQPVIPAPSNRRDAREAGMLHWLRMPAIDSNPMFLVSPDCPMLIEGLEHKFRFKRIGNSSDNRYSQEVEKNEWSHPCEAAEYAALHVLGYAGMLGPRMKKPPEPERNTDWQLRFGT